MNYFIVKAEEFVRRCSNKCCSKNVVRFTDKLMKSCFLVKSFTKNRSPLQVLSCKLLGNFQERLLKKGVLKNFEKLTGKNLCKSLFFLIKLNFSGLQLYSERDSDICVFLRILQNC